MRQTKTLRTSGFFFRNCPLVSSSFGGWGRRRQRRELWVLRRIHQRRRCWRGHGVPVKSGYFGWRRAGRKIHARRGGKLQGRGRSRPTEIVEHPPVRVGRIRSGREAALGADRGLAALGRKKRLRRRWIRSLHSRAVPIFGELIVPTKTVVGIMRRPRIDIGVMVPGAQGWSEHSDNGDDDKEGRTQEKTRHAPATPTLGVPDAFDLFTQLFLHRFPHLWRHEPIHHAPATPLGAATFDQVVDCFFGFRRGPVLSAGVCPQLSEPKGTLIRWQV